MGSYYEWESAVVQFVADELEVPYSDASAVVEGQPFYMQQSWGKAMDAKETAAKVLAAARQ
ncbi:hypothetical protein [Pseudomonas sp. W22_MBD1_FP4]|uniref:hypothetical protein n=1 Tax=Pseudomonas sp. W22_MBD1_FP4 TaxID=3240272 RepID=UPI003F9D178F